MIKGVFRASFIATAFLLLIPHVVFATQSITLSVSKTQVVFGDTIKLSGVIEPAGSEDQIVLETQDTSGAWVAAGTSSANAANGAWFINLVPKKSTTFRVRAADSSAQSEVVRVDVTPTVSIIQEKPLFAFMSNRVKVDIHPQTFNGKIVVKSSNDIPGNTKIVHVTNGKAYVKLKPSEIGKIKILVKTEGNDNFKSSSVSAITLKVRGRVLYKGINGEDVKNLMLKLKSLGFLTPNHGERYTFQASEVVLAFQKTYGLPRTYIWTKREWKMLARLNSAPKARYKKERGVYLEVDKTRQVMMLVANKKVKGIIAVSTGATGNTPTGSFRIYSRGGSYLYRFMAFKGNFGLHGYPSVPAHPASHGCVREPNWAASWVWDNTHIGTKIIIYS